LLSRSLKSVALPTELPGRLGVRYQAESLTYIMPVNRARPAPAAIGMTAENDIPAAIDPQPTSLTSTLKTLQPIVLQLHTNNETHRKPEIDGK